MALRLILSSCGNPDFGQDPYSSVSPSLALVVGTFEEASRGAQEYRDAHGLGGGNWISPEVVDTDTGMVVARISYNGRVWQPGDEDLICEAADGCPCVLCEVRKGNRQTQPVPDLPGQGTLFDEADEADAELRAAGLEYIGDYDEDDR